MKTNTIVKIELDKIHADERNFFETAGSVEIEQKNDELKDSIESDGLIHPIVVRPRPDTEDEYIIISGHRRKAMFQRLRDEGKDGFEKISAIIKNVAEGPQARMMLLEANTTQRESTDWEKAQAVKEYGEILDELKSRGEEMPGRRRDHIADALHMSRTNVGRLENINKNLSPEYQAELKAGSIGVSVADKLASKPAEEQKKIFETQGVTVKLNDLQPDKDEPAKTGVYTHINRLNIPEEYGQVIIIIGEQGGKFRGGYSACAIDSAGGKKHADAPWRKAGAYDTYEEAWDSAIMSAKSWAWIGELIDRRPAEENSTEEPEDANYQDRPDERYIVARRYAAARVLDRLEHLRENEEGLAQIDFEEGNEAGRINHLATADYLAELIDQVKDELEELEGE